MSCSSWNLLCKGASETAQAVHDSVLTAWGEGVLDGLDKTMLTLGTFWVKIPSPGVMTEGSVTDWATSETAWIQLALFSGSLMVAGAYLAWTRRGEQLRSILDGLTTVVLVSVAAVPLLSLLMNISDQTAQALLDAALGDANGNFSTKLVTLTTLSLSGVSVIVVIVLGLLGVIANLVQIGMMFVRSAMLVVCFAVVPLATAAAVNQWGRAWLKKMVGWTVSFILMKPAAALVYAVAIKLVEGNTFDLGEDQEMLNFVLGVVLMVIAAFALPALVGFVVPVSGSVGGGGSAGVVAAITGVVATGAMVVQRSSGGGGRTGAAGGAKDKDQAPTGAAGSAGAAGAAGAGSAGAAAATGGVSAGVQVAAQAAQAVSGAAQAAGDEATGSEEASR